MYWFVEFWVGPSQQLIVDRDGFSVPRVYKDIPGGWKALTRRNAMASLPWMEPMRMHCASLEAALAIVEENKKLDAEVGIETRPWRVVSSSGTVIIL